MSSFEVTGGQKGDSESLPRPPTNAGAPEVCRIGWTSQVAVCLCSVIVCRMQEGWAKTLLFYLFACPMRSH